MNAWNGFRAADSFGRHYNAFIRGNYDCRVEEYLSIEPMTAKIIKSIAIVSLLATSIIGCTKFSEGDCIQHVGDGFIWSITEVRLRTYTVQGWFDGKWGLPVDESAGTFDSLGRYVKISCPFSTQTLQERR
jgi:hypothetical protein